MFKNCQDLSKEVDALTYENIIKIDPNFRGFNDDITIETDYLYSKKPFDDLEIKIGELKIQLNLSFPSKSIKSFFL